MEEEDLWEALEEVRLYLLKRSAQRMQVLARLYGQEKNLRRRREISKKMVILARRIEEYSNKDREGLDST